VPSPEWTLHHGQVTVETFSPLQQRWAAVLNKYVGLGFGVSMFPAGHSLVCVCVVSPLVQLKVLTQLVRQGRWGGGVGDLCNLCLEELITAEQL
jgi:hypothetical protein